MDTKIGVDNVGKETVLYKEGVGTRKDTGESVINFSAQNSFLIG